MSDKSRSGTDIPVYAVEDFDFRLPTILAPVIIEVSFPDVRVDALAHEGVDIVPHVREEGFQPSELPFCRNLARELPYTCVVHSEKLTKM